MLYIDTYVYFPCINLASLSNLKYQIFDLKVRNQSHNNEAMFMHYAAVMPELPNYTCDLLLATKKVDMYTYQ